VIAAAGNGASQVQDSAPKHPLAITVGAAGSAGDPGNRSFRHSEFSGVSSDLDFVALGEPIYCLMPDAAHFVSDTRVAAAQAAGVCSLMAAVRPSITWREAYVLLAAGADDQGIALEDEPGWDPYFGWGMINAYNSVLLAGLKIDSIRKVAGNQIELSWPSPPNAIDRDYFRVDFTPSLDKPWIEITAGSFLYEDDRATWTALFQAGFYKLRLAWEGMPDLGIR
jgi:hypothetical protein